MSNKVKKISRYYSSNNCKKGKYQKSMIDPVIVPELLSDDKLKIATTYPEKKVDTKKCIDASKKYGKIANHVRSVYELMYPYLEQKELNRRIEAVHLPTFFCTYDEKNNSSESAACSRLGCEKHIEVTNDDIRYVISETYRCEIRPDVSNLSYRKKLEEAKRRKSDKMTSAEEAIMRLLDWDSDIEKVEMHRVIHKAMADFCITSKKCRNHKVVILINEHIKCEKFNKKYKVLYFTPQQIQNNLANVAKTIEKALTPSVRTIIRQQEADKKKQKQTDKNYYTIYRENHKLRKAKKDNGYVSRKIKGIKRTSKWKKNKLPFWKKSRYENIKASSTSGFLVRQDIVDITNQAEAIMGVSANNAGTLNAGRHPAWVIPLAIGCDTCREIKISASVVNGGNSFIKNVSLWGSSHTAVGT